MASQDDVRRIALALPCVIEGDTGFGFSVLNKGRHKGIAWVWQERIEPKKPKVPNPDVIAIRVANEEDKQMLLSLYPDAIFTEPHYNGFPAVLVRLLAVDVELLRGLIIDAWRCQAPKTLVESLDNASGR